MWADVSAREAMAGSSRPTEHLVADRAAGRDPDRLTLGRFLCDIAEAYAGHEAVVFEGRRLRFEELHADALHLASALVGAGVVKGARVALLMPNCPD